MVGPPPPPPGTPGVIPKQTYVRGGPQRPIPEKNAYPNPVEYSFEYWFNYFYAELNSDKRREYFVRISPTQGTYRAANAIPDTEKKALLDEMMKLGFRQYQTTEKLSSVEMFDTLKRYGPDATRVMFRGDSREPGMIEANMGTKPQTQLPHLAASRNFDKTWHPWNDKTRGNAAYFRNGDVNQDNCLFSAISVTPEFYVATKFPMIHQVTLGKALVEVEMPEQAGNSVAALRSRFERNRTITLPCSRTNIYAVKVKKGWNTEAFQRETFPERAYDNLRWVDHFAIMKVTRIHYDNDSNAGHLTIVDDWKMLPDNARFDANIRASMKKLNATNRGAVDILIQNLRSFLRKTVDECRLLDGVGGHSYVPEGVKAPFTIKKVLSRTY